jgi:Uma2 family endonuclease
LDALLVVEISDATLSYDRDVKVPMYARYAVPEVWIVDLKAKQLHAYTAPRDGTYTHEASVLGRRALATLPSVSVDLSALL